MHAMVPVRGTGTEIFEEREALEMRQLRQHLSYLCFMENLLTIPPFV